MAKDGNVGAVTALWRFPVKSMAGERLEMAELTARGLLGDRAFAILDVATGKVASAKSVRLFPGLLDCTAVFAEAPRLGRDMPPIRITLPNGQAVSSDSPGIDLALSNYFHREVRLAHAAREDSICMHPAFIESAGIAPPGPVGGYLDLYPITVMTTATLARLAELAPESRFDERRFRMNVIVGGDGAGFPENDWVGRELSLGKEVRLQVMLPDPRCAMTTLEQDGLPGDPAVLKTMVQHNSLEIGAAGLYPCAGIYAGVNAPGTLRVSDRVSVT